MAAEHFAHEVDAFLEFTGATESKPDSIFFMVMGMTGSGKSTFISRCTGQNVEIGHDLQSCTQSLAVYSFKHEGYNVHLIDTPGFDDTDKSDIDTLKAITYYLGVSYANRVYLGGIIYLHRISDNRMTGTNKRNIEMFQALCGEASYMNVAVVTTMWSKIERWKAECNETELFANEQWFGTICGPDGASRFRHAENATGEAEEKSSALKVVSRLIQVAQEGPVTLQVQSELVDSNKTLEDTTAGQVLLGEIGKVRKDLQTQLNTLKKQSEQALQNKDGELSRTITNMKAEARQQLEESERVEKEMKASLVKLHQAEESRLKKLMSEMEEEWQKQLSLKAREIADLKFAMEDQARQAAMQQAEQRNLWHAASNRSLVPINAISNPTSNGVSPSASAISLVDPNMNSRLMEMQMMYQRLQAETDHKKAANSKVRSALASGSLSGITSGAATAVISAALPALAAGLLCNVM